MRQTEYMNVVAFLDIGIDADSHTPVYAQICDALKSAIRDGSLCPGAKIPATRALAAQLGIAVNTVAKAYQELEREGVIEGRGRSGTFVRDPEGAQAQRLTAQYVEALRDLGITQAESAKLLSSAWK